MRVRVLLAVALLVARCLGAQPDPAPLPVGQVLPKVALLRDPACTYALYLPKGWSADRPHPVLFGFSPRGRGEEPVRLFQAAAEAFGWILVGANEVRNGELEPALKAQEALWREVRTRFRIAPKACFATGFSGGARMAVRLAQAHPGEVQGLATFGAFFAGEDATARGLQGTACFLACGLEDFNFPELRLARKVLADGRIDAWMEVHAGPHRWPPAEVALRAAQFLEAVRQRRPPPFLGERRAAARALEAAGEPLQALRLLEEVWAREVPADPVARRRLAQDPRAVRELALERTYEGIRTAHLAARAGNGWRASLRRISAAAHGPDPLEARVAWRLLWDDLSLLEGQGELDLSRRRWAQAEQVFEILTREAPEVGRFQVGLACALAMQGRRAEAWVALERALARGFADRERLQDLEGLAPLRGGAEWAALLARLPAPPGP